MTVNVELLEKTMQHIMDHPEEHDQTSVWSYLGSECGTPGCFVGWAMRLEGMTYQQFCDSEQGAQAWAVEHLGLDVHDTGIIFAGLNTIPMLQLMVKDAVNGTPLEATRHYRELAHQSGAME